MTGRETGGARWAAWALVAGGAASAALWLVFTVVHGPTSFNENNPVLGGDMHFWGMLLGVIPNVVLVAGLLGLRQPLLAGAGRTATIGYWLAVAALFASAAVDLVGRSLGPPLLMPFQGVGLVLVGLAGGSDLRRPLLAIGVLILAAFGFAWVPLEISDRFGGYRIFGFLAHFAVGVGWVFTGLRAASDG